MHAQKLSRSRRALACVLLSLSGCLLRPALAAEQVADPLVLPAEQSVRAQHSLQLALARAGDRLVAVGERGVVLLSDDAGATWRQAASVPVSVTLTDVHFVSASEGWLVGHSGVVLHSGDGGEHWQLQLDGNQVARIILDDARSRAATDSAEVRNAQRLVDDGPDKPLLGVRFVDARNGFVVGAYGIALATTDGGGSWHSLVGRIPNPRGNHLYQIQIDARRILIAGEQGVLFRSDDGGASFHGLSVPYGGTFFGVLGMTGERLLAYGLRGNAWRSEDGGSNWVKVDLGQPVTVTAGLRLGDGSLLLADESGRLLRSRDEGRSFSALPVHPGTGLTGIGEARDGALVLSSARGLARIELREQLAGAQ